MSFIFPYSTFQMQPTWSHRPPPLNGGLHSIITSLAIVVISEVYHSDKHILQVLVQWFGLPLDETSWEILMKIFHGEVVQVRKIVGIISGSNSTRSWKIK